MHFLEKHVRDRAPTFRVGPHAFVRVRLNNKYKTLTMSDDDDNPGIMVCKSDVEWVELPGPWKVIGPEGEITASGVFCVTTETVDPYHGLMDLAKEKERW